MTPIKRIPTLRTAEEFRNYTASLGIELPCEDTVVEGAESPLAAPVSNVLVNGKRIGNRFAVHPMEGWDGTSTGGATEEVRRRWKRFGESGAKLIYGGEAMAVRPDGRANPNQLVIVEQNQADLANLRGILVKAHEEKNGSSHDLVIGFQLTHSGRFCKPTDKTRMEPRVAYRHPILDRRFGVTKDAQVFSDDEIEELIRAYVAAARIAWEAGADFVDIKHCHGYLLHEFLSARTRPGKYGGSFENRTRILREIIEGIRRDGIGIDIGVRLSAFDFVPFRPDPALSTPGKPGPGVPEDYTGCLPYWCGFGVNPDNPVEPDLSEPMQFVELCARLGVKILNVSAGSPYYNPHIQRPAAYPPSDGYLPPEEPLVGVARQIQAVRQLKSRAPEGLLLVGTAYSYLQEYLPHVAQYVVRNGWVDLVGLGRVVLSYPWILADAVAKGSVERKLICRTFSDCTTAPRNGLISGCYPLDAYYSERPEFQRLKDIKKGK
jgi:NADPH2 dehydrogenase